MSRIQGAPLVWRLTDGGKKPELVIQPVDAVHNEYLEYAFAYGQTKLGDKGIRKTDDRIDLSSVLTYKLGVYANQFASVTFKSQFTLLWEGSSDSLMCVVAIALYSHTLPT